jgi:anti-sigma regulatory factor (Ser/Thr protein kinase)
MEPFDMKPLTVPGTPDSLKSIAEYVMAASAAAGLDKKASYYLRLAVDEIATNIITHGYAEMDNKGVLDLQAEIDEKTATIIIEDTGIPYDPRQAPIPDSLNQPLEKRKIGGLGVYLALRNVDKFLYERVGNRNRNIFVMNRTSATPEE